MVILVVSEDGTVVTNARSAEDARKLARLLTGILSQLLEAWPRGEEQELIEEEEEEEEGDAGIP